MPRIILLIENRFCRNTMNQPILPAWLMRSCCYDISWLGENATVSTSTTQVLIALAAGWRATSVGGASISLSMSGMLHIFRIAGDPAEYQVNYNLGTNSWAQVFTSETLDRFLQHSTGLPEAQVQDLWSELRANGHTTEANIEIAESHLTEMGFLEGPSDE